MMSSYKKHVCLLASTLGLSMISVQSIACELHHGQAGLTSTQTNTMLASAADAKASDSKGKGNSSKGAVQKVQSSSADSKEKSGTIKNDGKEVSPSDQRSLALQVEMLRKDIGELKKAMETKTAEQSSSTRTDVSRELTALQARLQELAMEIERSSDSSVATAKDKFKELLRGVGKDIESLGQDLQEKAK